MRGPDTLPACLELAASRVGLGVRFVGRREESHYTYAEIAERALEVAGALRMLGVRPSDRVAIAVPASFAFYEAFFGALFAGAIPAALPQPGRLGGRSDYARAAVFMIDGCGARLAIASERAQGAIPREACELGVFLLQDLPRRRSAPVPVAPTDLALVQFTSGTTDVAKPIGLTHEQVLANVRAILDELLKAYPEDNGFRHSAVSWLPLYHDMGLVGALLTSLVRPGPLTLMTPELFVARPARWLQTISKHRASVSPAPHFGYALCVDRVRDDELEGVDLSSWLLALDGAESVTPKTLERFLERFRPYGLREHALTPAYGLAEAGLAVTCSSIRGSYRTRAFEGRTLVSAGRPLGDFRVRISGGASGGVGKILVSGPSLMSGYLGLPDATRRVLKDGWLDTGDEGFVEDGELFLTGRNRDRIVVRGTNYAPEHFEEIVASLEGIGNVAAVGIVTEQGDELCILAEVRRRSRDTSSEWARVAIRDILSAQTGIVPCRIQLLDPGSLPRTSSGKLQRGEAARRFAGCHVQPSVGAV